MRRFSPFVLLLLVGLLGGAGLPVQAQPYTERPLADTLRALVVFVQFPDDTVPGNPNLDDRGWPLSGEGALPSFARTLLAPSPAPPYPDSSLTAYLHRQSLGQFVLFGAPYDSVLVAAHPEARYHRPEGGYGHLVHELLDRIEGYGFDFGPYDHNGDGRLDHLFVIVRGDSQRDAKRFTYTGIACLDARCGGGVTAGRPEGALVYDGVTVDWRWSGSILMHRTPGNILPHYYHVRLAAHELGHDLWHRHFTHIPALTQNDVPATSNRSRRGTDVLGYALMAGAGGGWDARGDETIAAFERDLLGWIRCTPLTTDRTITLGDLYATSDCATLDLPSGWRLYLTNRQRLGPFARPRTGGRDPQFEMGLLRTTGLLVGLADGVRYDVLPADNTLDLAPTDAPYAGDLYDPRVAPQLTPWTRPNVDGWTEYPPGTTPSWHGIDRIRYADTAARTLAIDFVTDIRTRPTIRRASWMGPETAGTAFRAPVHVTNGATLYIETAITLAAGLRVDPGATVVVGPEGEVRVPTGATIQLAPGATVEVSGTLWLDGTVVQQAGAALKRAGDGRIRVHVSGF